ncbi:citrate synthase [Puccinia graminis f. sp. tritici]|uniref:Citrate synthase n=1 Tax=Puccinia graminis f. sp. tritici TaxID=56615 RepID=A0A5B0PXX9_PUCGR|nr:citrate synthase [Puccinia graminis f. sp. tritici]KAA1135144.1 citrate synthase [Puccinia graminis f. sp. tritici]
MAAKLDQTADYLCGAKWVIGRETSLAVNGTKTFADRGPPMVFPAPLGRDLTKEEAYIQKLDASTGASLKLTVLNAHGRVWTMVAGGGASIVYFDAIAAHGFAHELANYGEYSGAPTKSQTFEYAKAILDLMTRGGPHPEGKVLIIGGGIANFTNAAATFGGIIGVLRCISHPPLPPPPPHPHTPISSRFPHLFNLSLDPTIAHRCMCPQTSSHLENLNWANPTCGCKILPSQMEENLFSSSTWNGKWLELSSSNFFSSSSSVSSWTQLIQLSQLKSAFGPSSVSSLTQLSQLLDPAQSALGPSSSS